MMLEIATIDIKCPLQKFNQEFTEYVDNWHCDDFSFKTETVTSAKGNQMFLTILTNPNSGELKIVAQLENNGQDIHFTNIKLKSYNNGYCIYSLHDSAYEGTDEDPSELMGEFLVKLAIMQKGSIAIRIPSSSNANIISDGKTKSYEGLAFIDSDGKVYAPDKITTISSFSDKNDGKIVVNKPIGEWISSIPELTEELKNHSSVNQKMDCIGKYLISKKLSDEIDSDEFMDIFMQAGVFGFSDPNVSSIYKLLT